MWFCRATSLLLIVLPPNGRRFFEGTISCFTGPLGGVEHVSGRIDFFGSGKGEAVAGLLKRYILPI